MDLDEAREKYYTIVKSYVLQPGEEELAAAGDLGRELVERDVPVEDVAQLHEEITERLARDVSPAIFVESAGRIVIPLLELVISYGMAFRGLLEKHKRAEEELAKHRELLEELVEERTEEFRRVNERFIGLCESSKDAIGWFDVDGTLQDVNEAFCQLTGYSKDELLSGKTYQDTIPKEYHEYKDRIIKRIIRTGIHEEYEKDYIRKDGSRVPLLFTVFAIRSDTGDITSVAAIIKDITERKRSEEALEDRTAELQIMVNAMAGRENRMAELKEAIKELRAQLEQAGMTPVTDDPLNEELGRKWEGWRGE